MKKFLQEADLDKILSAAALILSVAAYVLTCRWYLGAACAAGAIVCVIFHNRRFADNKVIRAALIISLLYALVIVLVLLMLAGYLSILR